MKIAITSLILLSLLGCVPARYYPRDYPHYAGRGWAYAGSPAYYGGGGYRHGDGHHHHNHRHHEPYDYRDWD